MINTFSPAFQKLKDVRRRRRFIANQIKNGFAFQVRALRKARNFTQQELAREAETTQALISRIESNGAANLSVKTLQKIADAFDVALIVRLEPIDRLLNWVEDLSPESMAFPKSEDILAEMEAAARDAPPKVEIAQRGIGKTSRFLRMVNTALGTGIDNFKGDPAQAKFQFMDQPQPAISDAVSTPITVEDFKRVNEELATLYFASKNVEEKEAA